VWLAPVEVILDAQGGIAWCEVVVDGYPALLSKRLCEKNLSISQSHFSRLKILDGQRQGVAVDVPSLESVRAVGMKEKASGRTCEWNRNTVDVQG
jgi:hypothetical protein